MRSARRTRALCLFALLVPSASAKAQRPMQPVDSALFVIRIGNDTSRYMWLIRDGRRLTTISANRIPTLRILRGQTLLGDDWSVHELDQMTTNPGAANTNDVLSRTRIWRSADSTIVEAGPPASPRRMSYAGVALFINTPHYYETLALIGGAPAVGDSLVGQHFAGTLFPPQRFVVRRLSTTAATAWSRPLGTIRMDVDNRGRVLRFDGAGTSALNFTGERVPWRDIDATIAQLLSAERSGRTFGSLSGRDSVRVTAGGAEIHVDYGRPTMRGRVIFGNIVPFDTVWRTGANRATHFTSNRAIVFAGRELPAGTYTLWTLPTRSGWTLIINRQTGQWGTEYDPSHDVLRIPMLVSTLAEPVEQFTISVDPEATGGTVRLTWEKTEARARFTLR